MSNQAGRIWGWTDTFVIAIRTIGFLISMVYMSSYSVADARGLIITLGLLAYAVPQLFYLPRHFRPRIFILIEFLFSVGYTLYITAFVSIDMNPASYLYMTVFVISYLSTKKIFYWVVLLCCVGVPFTINFISGYDSVYIINQVINFALFAAFGFSLGAFLRQKNQLAESAALIEEKNKELERYIYQVERVTLLEERNRMSRELHDTVGHSLTASIVAMEAIQKLIDRDPESAKNRLAELIVFNRNHLNKIRQTVHDMAMNELKLPLDELLEKLAEDFAKQTGTKVMMKHSIKNFNTSEAIKLAFLRCFQEALTNAKKHGNASEITMALTYENERLVLTVQDNGAGVESIQYGYGIEGMKQRIESLRGTLHISSKGGQGTMVICEIPMGE